MREPVVVATYGSTLAAGLLAAITAFSLAAMIQTLVQKTPSPDNTLVFSRHGRFFEPGGDDREPTESLLTTTSPEQVKYEIVVSKHFDKQLKL